MYIGLYVKYPLFLSDFNDSLILTTYLPEILKYQISLKSVQWEASCSMRTNRQTEDMTKLTVDCLILWTRLKSNGTAVQSNLNSSY